MTEIHSTDYYNDFIKKCSSKIESLNRQIHTNFSILYAYYPILDANYNKLIKYAITHNIDELLSKETNTYKYSRMHVAIEDLEFINTYNQFIDIINDTRDMISLHKKYVYINNIPFQLYKTLLYIIGQESAVEILKGNTIYIPKIGSIRVNRVPYKSNKPDWKASLAFKALLEEQGYETMSKDNPDGKAWLVDNGLNREDFWVIHWNKFASKIKGRHPYQLKTTSWDNTENGIPNTKFTIESCINTYKISLFTRLMYLYRNFYEETKNLYPFRYNIKKLS